MMKKIALWIRASLLAVALSAMSSPLRAEDIDIYAGVNGADVPNVLLVLDSSANWSSNIGVGNCFYKENGVTTNVGPSSAEQGKKVAIEKCALYNVIDALPVNPNVNDPNNDALFNVGLMLFNESPASNSGGYPRKHFTPLTTNNKGALKAIIRGLHILDDKGNNAAFAKSMYEAYLYFRGLAPYRGAAGVKWDRSAVANGRYVSPSGESCGRNYVIFIANGSPGEVTDNDARALLQAAGGDTSPIVYPNSIVRNSDQGNWADEFARFMRSVDVSGREGMQGIVTHGIAVTGASSDGLYPNFIRSMANHGGGSFFEANNVDALVSALLHIFNEIQSVNSVFASASLPVSVNARGTYLNQVFMGMFRPDGDGKPRWRGNLKQYKFSLDSLGALSLVDRNGAPAISATTGFLRPTALSHWTASSNFWSHEPMGTPPSANDLPDGEVVEKGGHAQWLRSNFATSQTARQVVTCIDCVGGSTLGATAATRFEDANSAVSQTLLGAASSTERTALINWVRGTNNAGEPGPATSPSTTVRPSVHGDVLHSRPAVVNYGGTTGVVVFYGANDGMLHAINGNQSGEGAGAELWSFVPQEVLGKLKRLRDNSPLIRLSTTPAALNATPRDYFVDGPIGVYQKTNASGASDRVVIFVGLRRGGRALYAIDVTTPASPRLLWKRSAADTPRLGQTWSEARAARIRGHANPVVIVGGGYDAAAEDASAPGATTMGNAVFVFDAFDGTLLKSFHALPSGGTVARSVAADVSLVDSNFDGYVDRAYAVDLGGQVYRVDFESAAGNTADRWSIYKLADLSGGTSTGRKFFFAPDVVVTRSFTALMFGSGDREKPLLSATQDHFFQIFDRRVQSGAPESFSPITWSDLSPTTETSSSQGSGCYVTLRQGEKVVNAATTIAGKTFFGTNRPSASNASNSCSANLGVATGYEMPLFCTSPSGTPFVGGGLPPSPVSGVVTVPNPNGEGTRRVPFIIGCPTCGAIGAGQPEFDAAGPRQRRYWFQEVGR